MELPTRPWSRLPQTQVPSPTTVSGNVMRQSRPYQDSSKRTRSTMVLRLSSRQLKLSLNVTEFADQVSSTSSEGSKRVLPNTLA
jgi:hypothetical protein